MQFENIFGEEPQAQHVAHGQVNILGSHADFNQGFALPLLTSNFITVSASRYENFFEVYSTHFKELHSFDLKTAQPSGWLSYVVGCLKELAKSGFELPGAKILIDSNLTVGMGLASSTALCVALLKVFRSLGGFSIDDKKMAHMAHQVEMNYGGMQEGLGAPMALVFGQNATAACIDFRYLITDNIAVPSEYEFLALTLHEKAPPADNLYSQRKYECDAAVEALNVSSLRDLSINDLAKLTQLSPLHLKRAQHILTENHRVLLGALCLKENRMQDLGQLMQASYQSLKDDFESSHLKADTVVEAAIKAGALGANLSGHKNIIVLVEKLKRKAWIHAMQNAFPGFSQPSLDLEFVLQPLTLDVQME